jgi:hypothetical protein
MLDNGFRNIKSVRQVEVVDASSSFWEIITDCANYYVKIPYDRMNLFPIWANTNEQDLVISALKRYRAEVGASSCIGIPDLLGKDDLHHAIIREKYTAVFVSPRQSLNNAIAKIIQFYKDNPIFPHTMEQINTVIVHEKDYRKADMLYKQLCLKLFPWQNYFMDYSLRVELSRWQQYYNNLLPQQQKCILPIYFNAHKKAFEAAKLEEEIQPTLNHSGCDYKNLMFIPEAILLDNEKIHIGWPGIDFADLLITYVQKNCPDESLEVWQDALSSVPCSIIPKNLLIGWILLGIIKEAISTTAQLNPIPCSLFTRTQIILKLFS